MNEAMENYGVFKGQVNGSNPEVDILVVLMKTQEGGDTLETLRTVRYGEKFHALVSRGDYYALAFEDANNDFAYQPGEAAMRIDNPTINWFGDMDIDDRIDPNSLVVQEFDLFTETVLTGTLDLSIQAVRTKTKNAENFLRVVTWDEPNFSAENIDLGTWQPQAFLKQIGFGLYVLDEFDADKDIIVMVHGISDSPRVFRELAGAIPDDYQLLMFHYPSSSPLEYTSHALSELLDEVVQRYDIEQIDVLAHSMGGLVSKGTIDKASPDVGERLRLFISIASPFGGHAAASHGIKWAPVVAPVWYAMAPGSSYLQRIGSLDLSHGPKHHLFVTYSHERGGERQEDDTVVSVESQLIESSRDKAVAIYKMADSHVGVMTNDCTLRMVPAILEDGSAEVTVPGC